MTWRFSFLILAGLLFPTLSFGFGVQTGDVAPSFELIDANGHTHELNQYRGQFVVLEWTNPDCPFVKKHYSGGNMQDLQEHYTNKDVVWLSIASSAKGKQGHYSAAEWKAILEEKGFHSTALLLDPNGQVGRMYGARTTPHMYVIDPEGFLVYQGGIDDRPSVDPGDILNSENYIRSVLNHILDGEETPYSSTEPYGCSVKY